MPRTVKVDFGKAKLRPQPGVLVINDKPFIPSPQQQAVIDWARDGDGSAFVEAVAGAGKTTTLVAALMHTSGTVAFAAYNRKIADEVKAKVQALNLGNRIRVGTFHSFGLNAWRQAYPKVKVNDSEKREASIVEMNKRNVPRGLHFFVLKLVSLAKQRALGLHGDIMNRALWYDIVDHFDLTYELDVDEAQGITVEKGIEAAIDILNYHRDLASTLINFDDMIYMPVVSGIKVWENDWVFIDEAQDTNPARRALARRMLKENGRSCWVGDRHQAIYGFTGADNDAIDQIIHEFSCSSLPLTITYRCPKTVVAEAQKTVAHIEAADTAPIGLVQTMENVDEFWKPDHLKTLSSSHAILCRLTKPLVAAAYRLIQNGIACHVEGREIGTGLIKLVGRYRKVNDLDELRQRLEVFAETECAKLVAKGRETQAEALQDKVDTIFILMNSQPVVTTKEELVARISSMFEDAENERKPTLTLSTVHKAKGREWPTVFILGRQSHMPSRWARQDWQKDQENNLIYVAVTRAQERLILVN